MHTRMRMAYKCTWGCERHAREAYTGTGWNPILLTCAVKANGWPVNSHLAAPAAMRLAGLALAAALQPAPHLFAPRVHAPIRWQPAQHGQPAADQPIGDDGRRSGLRALQRPGVAALLLRQPRAGLDGPPAPACIGAARRRLWSAAARTAAARRRRQARRPAARRPQAAAGVDPRRAAGLGAPLRR